MAESESGEERSEEATSKKKSQASEKGQIARSRELSAFGVLVVSAIALKVYGPLFVSSLHEVALNNFSLSREEALDKNTAVISLVSSFYDVAIGFIPFFLTIAFAAVVCTLIVGGWNLSWSAIAPDLKKMDPIAGLKKKVFSVNGLMELVKAIGKLLVVGTASAFIILSQFPKILFLSQLPVMEALGESLDILIWSFFLITLSVIVIAAIDVPFQVWNQAKSLKMTKDEVKREMKDTEGKPEVKGRIRQLQHEMANRRMMSQVPEADVIITNPTHFAIALKYDVDSNKAPMVVAKGIDFVAQKIREIGTHYSIDLVESPMLARAIFYTTELEEEIPEALYRAVAQILAYVYQLKAHRSGTAPKPGRKPDVQIPDGYRDY